ncbi:MAG: sialate O-acetylesterase [Ruminococcaceae bacterium]|nr:sialate O-acetylesterase [Oscillospiraceae bacterium]
MYSTVNLTDDYQIIQRGCDGYGRAVFSGILAAESIKKNTKVLVRAELETDGTPVIPWQTAQFDGCEWSIELMLPEGGLYRIVAQTDEGYVKILYHIGVGDIYLTMGQSNMTGYGRGVAYDPPVLGVHSFANDGKWRLAVHPLADNVGTLYPNSDTGCGTSPALSFARKLKESLNIPIGIIPTAVGGSTLSSWNPDQDGSNYKTALMRLEKTGKIKGILWYQGCTDATAKNSVDYFDRFARSVEHWRRDLGNVPVLTVQLNRWTNWVSKPGDDAADRYWGTIREAQRRAALEIDGVYAVASYDLPVSDGIHNGSDSNVIIGDRLASTALSKIYGRIGLITPCIVEAEAVDRKRIRIRLEGGHQNISSDNIAKGMNVEDKDGLIECTFAKAENGWIVITCAREYTLPAKYHYAWRCRTPDFAIKDYYGYPALACYGMEIKG